MMEKLPCHEIYGEYAKDQQHLQEESTNQGKRQPGDDGAGGFDHAVAGDELRRPEHAVRDQQRRAECGQQRNQGCVPKTLSAFAYVFSPELGDRICKCAQVFDSK